MTATAQTTRQDIAKVLTSLPREDLQIVLMSRCEELSDEEIAQVLGATSAAIWNRKKEITLRIERALKLKAEENRR